MQIDSAPFAEYISDYKIRVIDVAHIPKKKREQLTSDFREVADFFADRRKKNYKPSSRTLDHAEAVLKLMEVFTNDERYKIIETEILDDLKKGEKLSMCEFAERMENRGIQQGIQQGMQLGIQALVESLRKYHVPDEGILEEIIEQFSLSKKAARKYL